MAVGKAKKKRVTFTLDAPGAREVMLVGDFNSWDQQAHAMKKDKKGGWSKIILLVPGRYEYKFFVDGAWWNDPKNDQTVCNALGTVNNVLMVP